LAENDQDISTAIVDHLRTKLSEGKQLTAIEWKTLNRIIDAGSNGVDGSGCFLSGEDVAKHYGVTRQTILSHIRKGNFERNEDGTFDKAKTDAYYCDKLGREKKTIKGSAGEVVQGEACESPLSERIDEQRLRKLRAEAKAKEALVDQIYGTLIPLDTVKELWLERHLIVRSGLLSIVDRMPALLAGRNQKEIEKLLRDEVVSILNGFGKDGNFTPKSE
jgi:hypothetical protein